MRSNLVKLVTDPQCSDLAEIIVHARPPRQLTNPLISQDKLSDILNGFILTEEQRQTILQCLNTSNYSLVLGMPGTGKTFLISLLLYCLVKLDKKVLITAYTHSALDNMIKGFRAKFKQNSDSILRLRQSKSADDKDVNELIYDPTKFENLAALQSFLAKKHLFFTTCLSLRAEERAPHTVGCGHCPHIIRAAILKKLKFDVVIVDEASQVLEPILLESLFHAPRFVLIGDYFQISALVRSPDAASKRMSVSLLQRLCEANPNQVCKLTKQFRMNKDIMELSNVLVYDGCLQAASEAIAGQRLVIRKTDSAFASEPSWIREILSLESGVTLVDLDNFCKWRAGNLLISERETRSSQSKSLKKRAIDGGAISSQLNESFLYEDKQDIYLSDKVEEDMAVTLVSKMLQYGISNQQITVITPFNLERCNLYSQLDGMDIDVLTIDKSQGLDKDCVVVVFPSRSTSSAPEQQQILKSLPRLNVALTRAKKKLLLIGSAIKMADQKPLDELVNLTKTKGWIYSFDPLKLDEDLKAEAQTHKHTLLN